MTWEPNIDEARDMICEWLRANDVAPDEVPLRSDITWNWRSITLDVWVMDGDAPKVDGDEALTERRTVPLKRRPPRALKAALALVQDGVVIR